LVYLTIVKGIPENLVDAFAYCANIATSHYENFPVASWLLPHHIRPHVYSIYAFARTADDFADEPGLSPPERLDRLADWESRLDTCQVTPNGPVFEALAETIRSFSMPTQLFSDLISAFRQDVLQPRHESFEDLIDYASRSANPVGRLILTLFGYQDAERLKMSDAICTALQFTNFWQDIRIDFERDRIYLPQADMARHNVTEDDLKQGIVTEGFTTLLQELTSKTDALFKEGHGLPECVGGRLKYELRLTWLSGRWILQRTRDVGFDVFSRRPKLTTWPTLGLLTRSLLPIRAHT